MRRIFIRESPAQGAQVAMTADYGIQARSLTVWGEVADKIKGT
jgi:hypothetical protein